MKATITLKGVASQASLTYEYDASGKATKISRSGSRALIHLFDALIFSSLSSYSPTGASVLDAYTHKSAVTAFNALDDYSADRVTEGSLSVPRIKGAWH